MNIKIYRVEDKIYPTFDEAMAAASAIFADTGVVVAIEEEIYESLEREQT